MEQDLASLRDFTDAMKKRHEITGIPFRNLLHRLVEICGRAPERPPEVEDALPDYAAWLHHGEVVERLRTVLDDLGEDNCFSKHPLRWLGKGVLEADHPFEALLAGIERTEDLLESLRQALEQSGLPEEHRDTIEKIRDTLAFVVRAAPLAHAQKLAVLNKGSAAKRFDDLAARLAEKSLALLAAQEQASPWHDPPSSDDTQHSLRLARVLEKSRFRYLRPAFWRLRQLVHSRYEFTRHAVAPSMVKALTDLAAQHELQSAVNSLAEQASGEWQTEDVPGFCKLVFDLRNDRLLAQPCREETDSPT